ncbi:MAG: GIY-YIG nuclease family protein [Candidatus Scatosoma sp.]
MATSKKLEIVYHNGQPDGIRSIRRHLSTMTTYVIPRPLLSEAKKITGITRPGIYYLINENDDNKIAQIYIGQTRNGVLRLDDHNRSKDFRNKAIMFLADNKTFSLDIISGLEEYAIAKAHEANRYKIENSVKPKYEIDEYDLPSIEEIYEEIQFIMATQGYKMDNAKQSVVNSEIFHTSRNGILASGVYNGDKFQVLEGSQINLEKPAQLNKYNRLRKSLQSDNNIVFENGAYLLKTTLEFNTPSGAAEFVLGGSTNGWVEWKNENGITLDKVYRK